MCFWANIAMSSSSSVNSIRATYLALTLASSATHNPMRAGSTCWMVESAKPSQNYAGEWQMASVTLYQSGAGVHSPLIGFLDQIERNVHSRVKPHMLEIAYVAPKSATQLQHGVRMACINQTRIFPVRQAGRPANAHNRLVGFPEASGFVALAVIGVSLQGSGHLPRLWPKVLPPGHGHLSGTVPTGLGA